MKNFGGPEGGFFLWLPVNGSEVAAKTLWERNGVRTLPGNYLAQTVDGYNPGEGYLRVAMVAPIDELKSGLIKIRKTLYEQGH